MDHHHAGKTTHHGMLAAFTLAVALPGLASAYEVTIGTGTRAMYLRVGDGRFNGNSYDKGGNPGVDNTVNQVNVTVPAAAIGNTVDQAMIGTGRLTSDLDGFDFCTAGQTYIGGFFRMPDSTAATAVLRYSAPAALVSGTDNIPISQISWTSSGIGDTGTQPIPAGTFAPGTGTLATISSNTWIESCHSFSYGNDAVVPAGTYGARITYTFATP